MKWNLISWYTQTTNSFVVVYVVKILNIGNMLYDTLRSGFSTANQINFDLQLSDLQSFS